MPNPLTCATAQFARNRKRTGFELPMTQTHAYPTSNPATPTKMPPSWHHPKPRVKVEERAYYGPSVVLPSEIWLDTYEDFLPDPPPTQMRDTDYITQEKGKEDVSYGEYARNSDQLSKDSDCVDYGSLFQLY